MRDRQARSTDVNIVGGGGGVLCLWGIGMLVALMLILWG